MPDIYSTPTGVKIGLTYQRPAPQMTADEELLQSALLKKPVPRIRLTTWACWIPVIAISAFLVWRFN